MGTPQHPPPPPPPRTQPGSVLPQASSATRPQVGLDERRLTRSPARRALQPRTPAESETSGPSAHQVPTKTLLRARPRQVLVLPRTSPTSPRRDSPGGLVRCLARRGRSTDGVIGHYGQGCSPTGQFGVPFTSASPSTLPAQCVLLAPNQRPPCPFRLLTATPPTRREDRPHTESAHHLGQHRPTDQRARSALRSRGVPAVTTPSAGAARDPARSPLPHTGPWGSGDRALPHFRGHPTRPASPFSGKPPSPRSLGSWAATLAHEPRGRPRALTKEGELSPRRARRGGLLRNPPKSRTPGLTAAGAGRHCPGGRARTANFSFEARPSYSEQSGRSAAPRRRRERTASPGRAAKLAGAPHFPFCPRGPRAPPGPLRPLRPRPPRPRPRPHKARRAPRGPHAPGLGPARPRPEARRQRRRGASPPSSDAPPPARPEPPPAPPAPPPASRRPPAPRRRPAGSAPHLSIGGGHGPGPQRGPAPPARHRPARASRPRAGRDGRAPLRLRRRVRLRAAT